MAPRSALSSYLTPTRQVLSKAAASMNPSLLLNSLPWSITSPHRSHTSPPPPTNISPIRICSCYVDVLINRSPAQKHPFILIPVLHFLMTSLVIFPYFSIVLFEKVFCPPVTYLRLVCSKHAALSLWQGYFFTSLVRQPWPNTSRHDLMFGRNLPQASFSLKCHSDRL